MDIENEHILHKSVVNTIKYYYDAQATRFRTWVTHYYEPGSYSLPDIKNMFIKGGLCLGGALVVTYSVVNNLTGAGVLDDAFLGGLGLRLMGAAA